MQIISATKASQNFGALLDAVQRQPVRIQRHERDIAVIVSAEEFEKLRQLHVHELIRISEENGKYAESRGMTDELFAQLMADDE